MPLDYFTSFQQDFQCQEDPWLTYYELQPDKTFTMKTFSRSSFRDRACRLASYLKSKGVGSLR